MEHRRKKIIKQSVRDTVTKLLDEAHKEFRKGNKERSQRHVKMALYHIKKHKVRVPKDYVHTFCKKCRIVWIPGNTARVYFDRKQNCLRIECKKCKFAKRL
jgi:RNase P subunit RPR2